MKDEIQQAIDAHMKASNKFTQKYMAEVKRALGIDSDYALAKALKVSKTTVSNYRHGTNAFSPAVCHRVADILQVNAAIIVAAIEVDRHSGAQQKEIDTRRVIYEATRRYVLEPAKGVALALAVAAGVGTAPSPAQSAQPSQTSQSPALCVMSTYLRGSRT